MKILSVFLATIFAVCVLWGALVLGGSSIIKAAVGYYFNGQVVLENVKVSPRLEISFGKVNFTFPGHRRLSGTSRGVNVGWSFSELKPNIDIKIGPTEILNIGFDNALDITSSKLLLIP